jgi:MFS family permease
MIVLDASVVNIALPSAQRALHLHFSNDNRQWIVTAYALAFGSLLLVGGRLGDLIGRKRLLVTGLMGFAVASAVGGAAQSFQVLVTARALQGLFAALLAPAALSLVSTTFTDTKERATAFGIWGGIAGAAGAIGLLLGGVLTESFSWRWTLFINLAFAVPASIGAVALIRTDSRSTRTGIDLPGTVAATAGLFALVYGFAQAEIHGWGASKTAAFLLGGTALMARSWSPKGEPAILSCRFGWSSIATAADPSLCSGSSASAPFRSFCSLPTFCNRSKATRPT